MIFPPKKHAIHWSTAPSCPFPGAFEGGSDFADFTSAAPTADGFGDFVGRLMWDEHGPMEEVHVDIGDMF